MRRYTDKEQEHDPVDGRQGLSQPMRESHRRADESGDMARGSGGRDDGFVLRDIQLDPGRRGCRLHQRVRVGEGSAHRSHQLHLSLLSQHIRYETVGRDKDGRAPRTGSNHSEREPSVDQSRGLREHFEGGVQGVSSRVREGRVGSQRAS